MKQRFTNQRAPVLALAVGLLSACGIKPQDNYDKMRGMLTSGRFDSASDYIKGQKASFYGDTNLVLFYMDHLAALHHAKRFKESNGQVEAAARKIEDMYTTSVSTQAAAIMTSDNVIPYEGEDFEKALIHVYGALNYTFLGETDEALVEARRVEQKLQTLNDLRGKEGKQNQYSEDAFIRWFSGCLYETDGDDQAANDAIISYRKALDAYEKSYTPKYKTPTPRLVASDMLRVAERLGFKEDAERIKKAYSGIAYDRDARSKGSVVFLHFNGESPYKIDKSWEAITPDGKVVKVAYPEYRTKSKRVVAADLKVGGVTVRTELFEDVNEIAVRNLDDHMGRIKAKMIARALAKYAAAKIAEETTSAATKDKTAGFLVGLAASIAGAVTEQADKRSWLMLPSSIDVAKAYVPPGEHEVTVSYLSSGGGVVETKSLGKIKVVPNKTIFLSDRTF